MADLERFYGKRNLADSDMVCVDVSTVAGDGVPLRRRRTPPKGKQPSEAEVGERWGNSLNGNTEGGRV